MAVRQSSGQIILTGNDGKSFSQKMKNPDISASQKRDAFIKDASVSRMVTHQIAGKIVLKNK